MEYYHFFVDAWRFFKRYKDIATDTQEFYDSAFEAAERLVSRYCYQAFAVNIAIAIVNELIQKAERKEHDSG